MKKLLFATVFILIAHFSFAERYKIQNIELANINEINPGYETSTLIYKIEALISIEHLDSIKVSEENLEELIKLMFFRYYT